MNETAILAAGCFWGVQFYFDQVPGVLETEVGYIGGHTNKPTYEDVLTHTTGHAEATKITYDPAKVIEGAKASLVQGAGEQRTEPYKEYGEGATEPATPQQTASLSGVASPAGQQAEAFRVLLRQFFRMHDPTQLNRQGPDIGDNYRSAIFYSNEQQKRTAEAEIKALDDEGKFSQPIVTTVEKAGTFWPAEDYHQKFTERTGRGMCHVDYAPV